MQQRAYELQAIIRLDAQALENILPLDASCEDIEVTCSMILYTTCRTYIFGWIVSFMSFNARSFIASLMLSPMKFMLCYQSNKHYTVFVQHIVCTM